MSTTYKGTGAEILVEALVRAGVMVLFGFPGDTGVALYDALARRQDQITHVLARDERAAASMADGYARASRRIGVVEASSGGGATFLVGGLGEPFAASVPLLVITSDIHRSSRGTSAITEVDQQKLFSAVTKAQWVVERADDMADRVMAAVALAWDGRPGPVSLIIPEDVFDEPGTADFATVAPGSGRDAQTVRQPAWPSAATAAAQALSRARRPALLLGSGVHWSQTYSVVRELAEHAGAGVATTIHGKGAFDESHPLSLGVVGANGARDYANRFLADADVVLMVGTRANSTDTDGFQSPRRGEPRVFHLDIDPTRAGRNYPGSTPLVGDAAVILPHVLKSLPEDSARRSATQREILAERARFEQQRALPPQSGLSPRDVVEALQAAYGHQAVVVGDAGTPTPYLAAYWRTEGTRREVILPRGHGAMGFALPTAVGLAWAEPERPIIALTTDGSLGMACGELDTIARLDSPVLILHLSNGSLGWIKALQHFYLERRYFGVDLKPVDAVKIAEGFGIPAIRTPTLAALQEVIAQAKAGLVPRFVDIPVPEEFDYLPPVAPWAATLVGAAERPVY
ncbi:MAG: thiamine pyrophosphate-binding protein [Thermaerobacter sp.]|nr:thiamine pyrophosphate-binding protein [Thermaerobacter sp.]